MTLRFFRFALVALVGCSGTPADLPEAGLFDARDVIVDPRDATVDTLPPDDAVQPIVDVVVFDAPPPEDTPAPPEDAGPPPVDAFFPDASAPPDAAPPLDRPLLADAARDAPAPPPDAAVFDVVFPFDAPMTPCADLAERYAAAVREGQACGPMAGCEARVCETLCCVCEVFITNTPERMRTLNDLRARAAAMGCVATALRCPITRCPTARSGACSTDGRCVTLRDPPDGGSIVPPPDARDR